MAQKMTVFEFRDKLYEKLLKAKRPIAMIDGTLCWYNIKQYIAFTDRKSLEAFIYKEMVDEVTEQGSLRIVKECANLIELETSDIPSWRADEEMGWLGFALRTGR